MLLLLVGRFDLKHVRKQLAKVTKYQNKLKVSDDCKF